MGIASDLRYAFRFLTRAPAFTLPAVLSLALGIAVNTTMFSIVNVALLKPLAARNGGELVRVGRSLGGDGSFRSVSYDEYTFLRGQSSSFAELAGAQMEMLAVDGPKGTEMVAAELIAGNYFQILGAPLGPGRSFSADEDSARASGAVAIVSDRFWRRWFNANPAVVGAPLRVNNVLFTVVGVAAPEAAGVAFPGAVVDLWLPMPMTPTVMHRTDGAPPSMGILARLKDGVSISAARAELRVLSQRMSDENPGRDRRRGFEVGSAQGMHPGIAGAVTLALLLLMGVVAVVLLIACANVASALLARGSARQRELAVRLALGASRTRVVTQLMTESLLLACLGGGAGLLLSVWPVRLLNVVLARVGPPEMQMFLGFQIDARVLLFTGFVSTLTALGFGLLPALHATRVDLVPALKDSRSIVGPSRSRLRGALMIGQVALSFVLLVAAGLLFRSLRNTVTIDVGFNPDQLVVASFSDLRSFGYDSARVDRFHREWLDRVRTLPGIERAALAGFVPLGGRGGARGALRIPGMAAPLDDLTVAVGGVSDEYFRTLGQALVRGRDFTRGEVAAIPRMAIVNESMARQYWPGDDALGKQIQLGEGLDTYEIVGVASDSKYASFRDGVDPFVVTPSLPARILFVRTSRPPAQVLADLERVAHEIEASLPPYTGRTMRDAMAESLGPVRVVQMVVGTAGIVALFLTVGGLYGLVCFTLEKRLKEVGIRIALGATRVEVLRLIVGGVVGLTAVGVLIGVSIAAAAMRLMSALLYGLSPSDPMTFGGIAAMLLLVTLAAGYGAVHQGLKNDPMTLLRAD
jgi:predicted permease